MESISPAGHLHESGLGHGWLTAVQTCCMEEDLVKEVAGFSLGRQVPVLQAHAAILSNLCWQCHAGCQSGKHVEIQSQGSG